MLIYVDVFRFIDGLVALNDGGQFEKALLEICLNDGGQFQKALLEIDP